MKIEEVSAYTLYTFHASTNFLFTDEIMGHRCSEKRNKTDLKVNICVGGGLKTGTMKEITVGIDDVKMCSNKTPSSNVNSVTVPEDVLERISERAW